MDLLYCLEATDQPIYPEIQHQESGEKSGIDQVHDCSYSGTCHRSIASRLGASLFVRCPSTGGALIVMALLCPAIFLDPPIRVLICNRVLLCAWVFAVFPIPVPLAILLFLGLTRDWSIRCRPITLQLWFLTTILVMLQCHWLRMTFFFLLLRVCD
jgi:hypothetical protein